MIAALRMFVIIAVSVGLAAAVAQVRGLPWMADVKKLGRMEEIRATRGVDLDAFQMYIDSGAMVIDARPHSEFEKGHLDAPLLMNVNAEEVDQRSEELLPFRDQPVVIYCTSLDCDLAEELYVELEDKLLFTDMHLYLPGWRDGILKNGLPTRAGPAPEIQWADPAAQAAPGDAATDQPPEDLAPSDSGEEAEGGG